MKASIALFAVVALLAAPFAEAAPLAQPVPAGRLGSSDALKNAASAGGVPLGIGLAAGVTGGFMLSSALASVTAGAAVTVGLFALPVVLLAGGVALAGYGSWRAYKALSADHPVVTPPAPPTSSPGLPGSVPGPVPGPNPGNAPTGTNIDRYRVTRPVRVPPSATAPIPGAGIPH